MANSTLVSMRECNGAYNNATYPCYYHVKVIFFYSPSSRIASCVRTAGTVMRPCYVALGWVLIWVVCPDWFETFVNWVKGIISLYLHTTKPPYRGTCLFHQYMFAGGETSTFHRTTSHTAQTRHPWLRPGQKTFCLREADPQRAVTHRNK